jgi:hypothetical protein
VCVVPSSRIPPAGLLGAMLVAAAVGAVGGALGGAVVAQGVVGGFGGPFAVGQQSSPHWEGICINPGWRLEDAFNNSGKFDHVCDQVGLPRDTAKVLVQRRVWELYSRAQDSLRVLIVCAYDITIYSCFVLASQ